MSMPADGAARWLYGLRLGGGMSADNHDLGSLQLEENPATGPAPEHALRSALTDHPASPQNEWE